MYSLGTALQTFRIVVGYEERSRSNESVAELRKCRNRLAQVRRCH